jgi:hypothetical protein
MECGGEEKMTTKLAFAKSVVLKIKACDINVGQIQL